MGTYCLMFAQPYDKSYGTNFGEYRDGVYYSVSSSYSYTLNLQDPGTGTSDNSDKPKGGD